MSLLGRMILWHRRSGLIVIPMILMLAVTGILINHSQSLGFAGQPVHSRLIGWLYGVQPEEVVSGYSVADHWVSQQTQTVYLNQQPLQECDGPLLGAVYWQQTLAILCDNRISLFLEDGRMVEQLPTLPIQASSIGLFANDQQLAISAPAMRLDDMSWRWQDLDPATEIQWAAAKPLPESLAKALNQNQPLPGINVERVLLDLHSGRLFGPVGVWVVDAASVVFIFLALSGFYSWQKRTFRKHR